MLEEIYHKFANFINSDEVLNLVFDNRFFLILMVIVLINLKSATYKNLYLSAIINVPGTILHELSHFIVGLVLNAQPCNFSIFPKKDNQGNYVMGAVSFRNITFYNAVPAALSPLILLIGGFYINRYMLPLIPPTLPYYTLYILLQTIIIENAMPSKVDFQVAGKYASGVILYFSLFLALLLI